MTEQEVTEQEEPAAATPRATGGAPGPGRALTLLAGLVALLAAGLVAAGVLTGYFADQNSDKRAIVNGSEQALTAASKEIVTVSSYSYQTLAANEVRTKAVLTPAFRTKYVATFVRDAEPAAKQYHAVVTASVQKAAIETYGAHQAVIMIFLDQTSTETVRSGPQTSGYRALVSMQKVGSRWLISNITLV